MSLSHLPLKFMPPLSIIIIVTYNLLGSISIAHMLTDVGLTAWATY